MTRSICPCDRHGCPAGRQQRRAVTLIEVLVAVVIVAVLVGLLLPAVQSVQQAAVKTQSGNKLRQLAIGMHLYAERWDGKVADKPINPGSKIIINPIDLSISTFVNPFPDMSGAFTQPVNELRSPADFTFEFVPNNGVLYGLPSSYSANMTGFAGPARLHVSFRDGTSNTIAIAERYARTDGGYHPARFSVNMSGPAAVSPGVDPESVTLWPVRPCTFADAGWLDVVPVTAGPPLVAKPSVAGVLFQVRPTIGQADGHQLQTPYASGLLVALFDGSVRTIHPNVSEGVVWRGAVTPAGGEVADLD